MGLEDGEEQSELGRTGSELLIQQEDNLVCFLLLLLP